MPRSKTRTREGGERGGERPNRGYSGIYGRKQWWTERVGGEATLRRLTAANEAAGAVLSTQELRDSTLQSAMLLLAEAGVDPDSLTKPMLLSHTGKRLRLRSSARGEDETAVGRVGPTLTVGDPGEDGAVLFLPLMDDADDHAGLELAGAGLVRRDEGGVNRVVEATSTSPNGRLLTARLQRGGTYEAYGRPTDPWLLSAIRTVDAHWDWITAEGKLGRELEMPDRICQLILCAPEWRLGEDELATAGLGRVGHWNAGGTVCDRCVGALRPIDPGGRGELFRPPLLALVPWWWPWWRSCSWRAIGPYQGTGFAGIGRITQLDVHPTDPNNVVAAAAGGGVWRTFDGGLSWGSLMSDQPSLTMGGVARAPSDAAVVYAASGEDGGGWNPAWPGVGVYRSTNSGATWTLTSPLPSDEFSAVVVHPTDPNTVYVAGDRGLHKSRDGGVTWLTNPGLGSLLDGRVTDVVVAHDDPSMVYAAISGSGVFRSTTGGEGVGASPAFTRLDGPGQLPSGAAAGWVKLTIGRAGAHGSQFLAAKLGNSGSRIFRTVDGGTAWTELAANVASVSYDEWCSIITVNPSDEGILLAGGVGLQRTTNGGAAASDWAGVGGVHADQQDAAFCPGQPATGYLANDGGVYRTTDGGATWEFRSNGLQITQLYDMATSRFSSSVVVGGAQDNGVYYRATTGVWRHRPWGDGTGVAVDPTDPAIFYYSSQNGVPNWLQRSTDGGLTFQPLGTGGLSGGSPWVTLIKLDPTYGVADPANNRTLFVCGTNQLFRSTDGGSSWQRVEDAAGAPFTTQGAIASLEYATVDATVLYLGTSTGFVYRGTGGGATAGDWTLLSPPGSPNEAMFPDVPIQSLSISPADADVVWVAFTGFGASFTSRWEVSNPLGASHVFGSTDGGATWTDRSGSFVGQSLPDIATSAVAFHPTSPDTVYVGTDVGVFRSTDSGLTWTSYRDGLPRSPVTDLSFGSQRLFAATMGRGIHYRDV